MIAEVEPAIVQNRMRPGIAYPTCEQAKTANDFKTTGPRLQQGRSAALIEAVEPSVRVDCRSRGEIRKLVFCLTCLPIDTKPPLGLLIAGSEQGTIHEYRPAGYRVEWRGPKMLCCDVLPIRAEAVEPAMLGIRSYVEHTTGTIHRSCDIDSVWVSQRNRPEQLAGIGIDAETVC